MPEVVEVGDSVEAVRLLERVFAGARLRGLRRLLEERGMIRRCSPLRLGGRVYAVDSAFPSSPVNLVGGSLSLVAVGAVRRGDAWRTLRRWLVYESFGDVDADYVRGFARLQERRLAVSLEGPEAVIIDGELVPRPGRSSVWSSVVEESRRLVGLAERGVLVAGVLKRSYSRTIASRLGLPVSDRALASAVLDRGEVLEAAHPSRELAERGCVEAFYKPLRGPPLAVKLEACCPRGADCCGLAAFLASEAGATGF
ncbi:MAG: DNA double-strand break repair nuclease NurA, partial [Crenarchaeota archaeon]|nr:DNA double-strand break repair nuclease NurA [Thermoproteota archaeon]